MQRIQVIAFDYYGTLEDIHTDEQALRPWEILAHFMRFHGAAYGPKQLRQQFDRLMKREALRLKAELPAEKAAPVGVKRLLTEPDVRCVLKQLYAACGIAADDSLAQTTAEVLRAACMDYFRLFRGTEEMLAALRASGKRLALLSNAQSAFTRPELAAVGIEGAFDRIFISSEEGVRKPCAAFYRRLIDWAGVSPEAIMMVGNSAADDIIPARQLGLRTCYIPSGQTPKGEPRPESDLFLPKPDMVKLTELLLHAML